MGLYNKFRKQSIILVIIFLLMISIIPVIVPSNSSAIILKAQGTTITVNNWMDIAWPYTVPWSFNPWSTNFLSAGIWQDLITPPLAEYIWYNRTWIPFLAESWNITYFPNGTGVFIIHLIKNNKWSDGIPFTALDVKDTFLIDYAFHYPGFLYISPQIDTPDNYTVVLHIVHPASPIVLEWDVLYLMPPEPAEIYGQFANKVAQLIAEGYTSSSQQMYNLTRQIVSYNPTKYLADGPYEVDVATITTDTYWIIKNPYSAWVNQVKFDALKNHNGETPVIAPLVLAKEVDYATHGFPLASAQQFQSIGYTIASPPILSGPALYLNYNDSTYGPLFKHVRFRQAILYALNLSEVAYVSLGPYAKVDAPWTFSGTPMEIAENWILPGYQIMNYTYNQTKATQLLESLGLTKSGGVWYWNGKPITLTLIYPAEYADWGATAQNIAQQLTAFGIKIELKAVTYSEEPTLVRSGQFQLAIRGWGSSSPTPFYSYYNLFSTYNQRYYLGVGTPGISLPMIWNVDGKIINVSNLIYRIGYSLNVNDEREAFSELAVVFSEYLPVIPLWERYGDNPVLEGVRVDGWLPLNNPLWQNPVYVNNPAVLQVWLGILYPNPSHTFTPTTLPFALTYTSSLTTSTTSSTSMTTTSTTTTTSVTQSSVSYLLISIIVIVIVIIVVAVIFLKRKK